MRPAGSTFMPSVHAQGWGMNIILGILVQCDTDNDLKLCIIDVHFMVQ